MDTSLERKNYIIHPHKFALWLFLITVTMAFAGWTSAYIVQMSFLNTGERIIFQLPDMMWNNLAIILFSSISMQFAMWATKKGEYKKASIGLGITLFLGILFLIGQYQAWDLMDDALPPVDKARTDNLVAYFYLFVLLHGLHIISAIIVLLVNLARQLRNKMPQARRKKSMELATTFWHFLGVLWIYLFVFMLYTQQSLPFGS